MAALKAEAQPEVGEIHRGSVTDSLEVRGLIDTLELGPEVQWLRSAEFSMRAYHHYHLSVRGLYPQPPVVLYCCSDFDFNSFSGQTHLLYMLTKVGSSGHSQPGSCAYKSGLGVESLPRLAGYWSISVASFFIL